MEQNEDVGKVVGETINKKPRISRACMVPTCPCNDRDTKSRNFFSLTKNKTERKKIFDAIRLVHRMFKLKSMVAGRYVCDLHYVRTCTLKIIETDFCFLFKIWLLIVYLTLLLKASSH